MNNILSAAKVKDHGFTDTRWKTKNRLLQYKGLLNLQLRDKKVLENDFVAERKKQIQQIKKLQNEVKEKRAALDCAVNGDRQFLRVKLSEHKDMQLAYQDTSPTIVADAIFQQNFHKRKKLDILSYKLKQAKQKLIDLKIEESVLEDSTRYVTGRLPIEEQADIISGNAQAAVIKREAALSLCKTYKRILDIMKKDAMYFYVILDCLHVDSVNQVNCMRSAISMGQIATEYQDDRKAEFESLEKIVKADTKYRLRILKAVRESLATLGTRIQLIRKDEFETCGTLSLHRSESEIILQDDVKEVEELLNFLQSTAYVLDHECILPCLKDQANMNSRLKKLEASCRISRDTIRTKTAHAELVCKQITHSMVETTNDYKEEKKELLEALDEQDTRKTAAQESSRNLGNVVAGIRVALTAITEVAKVVKSPAEVRVKQLGNELGVVYEPLVLEVNGLKMMRNLLQKVPMLVKSAQQAKYEVGHSQIKRYQELVTKISKTLETKVEIAEEFLVLEVELDDPQVPSWNEIKQQSRMLLEKHMNQLALVSST